MQHDEPHPPPASTSSRASTAASAEDPFNPPTDSLAPHMQDYPLAPPLRPFSVYSPPTGSPRDSYAGSGPGTPTPDNSSPLLVPLAAEHRLSYEQARSNENEAESGNGNENVQGAFLPAGYNEKGAGLGEGARARGRWRRRPLLLWLGGLAALATIVLAVVLPVIFTVGRPRSHKTAAGSSPSSSSGSGSGGAGIGGSGNPASPNGAVTGGDGSLVTTDDGTTFTYQNAFGGYWVADPNDPFNNDARPNSWTPPLNTSWTWGVDRVYGVNLGGLFVLEPFISPALFQRYQNLSFPVIDEWSLSQALAADTANGGLSQLEDHYNTFITEQDIAQIAGAGLNWIRVPIPFWAIEVWPGEPFLPQVCWKYILRVLGWARKYGLRVNLDLHTIPGSQNGYNHSGKDGQINFLRGVMGSANAQRALGYIRIITEFITQSEYQNLVPMFGIVNEAREAEIGRDALSRFYLQAHETIRGITGLGEGNGAYISIHDGFQGTASWANFFPGSDRIMLDTHPYFAFNGQPNLDPIGVWPARACNAWGPGMNTSQTAFGVTVAGEFSNGINDCGLYLNGVGNGHNYGGDCDPWEDATTWNQTLKDGLKEFALASMDALQDWWFWTWKIGNSTAGSVQSPLWSYQLGLEGGWMPTDPREAVGACAALGVQDTPFDGTYSLWQTGGPGAGTISPDVVASFTQWPPPSLSGLPGANGEADAELVPTYTATGPVSTLPPPTLTAPGSSSTISAGDGWADAQDTAPGVTPVAGCTYPNAWDSDGVVLPTALCPATGPAAPPVATPPPVVPIATPPPAVPPVTAATPAVPPVVTSPPAVPPVVTPPPAVPPPARR